MTTLLQQAFRRKPVTAMSAESGADSGGGELARPWVVPAIHDRIGATIGTVIFSCCHRPYRSPGCRHLVVRHRRRGRGTGGNLLRA